MNWLLIIIIHHTVEKYWSPSLWKILIISIIISIIYLIITEHYPDTLLSWCYGNQMGRRYHSTKTENQFVAVLHLMKFYVSDPCDLWGGSVQEYVLPCTEWSRLRQWRRRSPPCHSLASICPGVVTGDHLDHLVLIIIGHLGGDHLVLILIINNNDHQDYLKLSNVSSSFLCLDNVIYFKFVKSHFILELFQ